MQPEHNSNDVELSSGAEEIAIDSALAHMLALLAFPNARAVLNLERLVPVRHVRPCPDCGAPVARVRLGRETRVVDCFRDELHSRDFAPAWDADVCAWHECAGCVQ
jgi:hypothetical protein